MTTRRRPRRRPISAAALVAVLAIGAPAYAGDRDPLAEYLARIKKALEDASAARAPRPPVPVPVTWKARPLGSLGLPAPLLALESGDLDGDGRDELIGLTTGEVLVLAVSGGQLAVGARAALPDKPALVRSRDPVGALVIDGAAISARSSEQGAGGRYRFKSGQLVLESEIAGFPLCQTLTAELAAGRNYFDPKTARWSGAAPVELTAPFYAIECRRHVGTDGQPLASVAIADTKPTVRVSCSRADRACDGDALASSEVLLAGYAFEVADVDRDGRLEVIASNDQAPGRKDWIRAFTHDGDKPGTVFDHRFDGGVVAMAAPDLDGDGALDVIAAVRPWRQKRIELWVLTRPR